MQLWIFSLLKWIEWFRCLLCFFFFCRFACRTASPSRRQWKRERQLQRTKCTQDSAGHQCSGHSSVYFSNFIPTCISFILSVSVNLSHGPFISCYWCSAATIFHLSPSHQVIRESLASLLLASKVYRSAHETALQLTRCQWNACSPQIEKKTWRAVKNEADTLYYRMTGRERES